VFVARRGPKRPPTETRRLVAELLGEGFSYSEIAERLDVVKSVIAYHARRIGIEADDRFARRYDWAEIQRVYDSGLSVRECAQQFGFTLASWHKAMKRGDVIARPRAMLIESLLVRDRPQTGRGHLKHRLLRAGLKENRCEQCGITEWQGKPLTMHLHHANGDGKDNRLENIVFLCGNCHAQTDTYGGRNGHRRKRAA
jgi:transposase